MVWPTLGSRTAKEQTRTSYGMHFPAILSNYNGMTAYICRRFIPTTAFLVFYLFLTFLCQKLTCLYFAHTLGTIYDALYKSPHHPLIIERQQRMSVYVYVVQ